MVWIEVPDELHKQATVEGPHLPAAGCGNGYGCALGEVDVDERMAPLVRELWYGLQKHNADGDLIDYCRTFASCQGDLDGRDNNDGCGYIMVQWSWRKQAAQVIRRMCGPVVDMHDCGNSYWPPRTWAYIRFQWKVGT